MFRSKTRLMSDRLRCGLQLSANSTCCNSFSIESTKNGYHGVLHIVYIVMMIRDHPSDLTDLLHERLWPPHLPRSQVFLFAADNNILLLA